MDLVIVILWMIYFIPFTVAMRKEHPHWLAILLLNGFLGWTGIGWLGALRWARTPPDAEAEPDPLLRRGHLRLYPGGAPASSEPSVARRSAPSLRRRR